MNSAKNYKILLADDEQDIRESLGKMLVTRGYQVVIAADGQQAWDKILTEAPDIILLDINMPHLNGFEVLQKLRENPPTSKWQPVIIVSGRYELDDMQKGYSLEADHYVVKPCDIHDIEKSIKLMINLIPQRKQVSE